MPICVRAAAVAALLSVLVASTSSAQGQETPPLPAIVFCGQQAPAPRAPAPAGSRPVVLAFGPCFEGQGGVSVIEPQTYLYYIQLKQSRPSEGVWIPYADWTDKMIEDGFRRLWNTNCLDNLFIEAKDYTFPNGTIGKVVTYNME